MFRFTLGEPESSRFQAWGAKATSITHLMCKTESFMKKMKVFVKEKFRKRLVVDEKSKVDPCAEYRRLEATFVEVSRFLT